MHYVYPLMTYAKGGYKPNKGNVCRCWELCERKESSKIVCPDYVVNDAEYGLRIEFSRQSTRSAVIDLCRGVHRAKAIIQRGRIGQSYFDCSKNVILISFLRAWQLSRCVYLTSRQMIRFDQLQIAGQKRQLWLDHHYICL